MEIIRYTNKLSIQALENREISKDEFIKGLGRYKQPDGDIINDNILIKIIIPDKENQNE